MNVSKTLSIRSIWEMGVGVIGYGKQLLEELFTFQGGFPADLQQALDDFFATKRKRAARLKKLQKKAALPGVKGLTAKNEIAQINAQSGTEMNRLEITLNAAKRRAMRKGGGGNAADVLAAKQKKEAAAATKLESSPGKAECPRARCLIQAVRRVAT